MTIPPYRAAPPPEEQTGNDVSVNWLYDEAWRLLAVGDYDRLAVLCPRTEFNLSGIRHAGLTQLRQHIEILRQAFSGFGQDRVEDARFPAADGSYMATHDQRRLRHNGQYQLPGGITIEPTGREFDIYGVNFIRRQGDTIARWDTLFNIDVLIQQMTATG